MLRDGRPTGVTVLAVLAAIGGIAPLAYGIISIIASASTLLSAADSPALPILLIGVVWLGVAAIYLGVAWALFGLRPWAWLAVAVVAGGHLVLNLIAALGGDLGWPQAVLASVVPIIILVYLFRGDVKAAFGR